MAVATKDSERLPPLKPWEKMFFTAWLFGILILVSAPLVGGYVGTVMVYGSGAIRQEVRPWVTPILVGALVVWLIISQIVENLLHRSFPQLSKILREIISTGASFVTLAALYGAVFTTVAASAVAAMLACLLFLALMPLMSYLEKRSPKRK